MKIVSPVWLDVLSDLFVNLSAGWLAIVFIEPQIGPVKNIFLLLLRCFSAILSLVIAKILREEAKKYD